MMLKFILFFSLLLCSSPALTSTLIKEFKVNSLTQLQNLRSKQPFIMVLWSIDCPPCLKELELLQQHKNRLNKDNLVLISTDDVRLMDTVYQTLKQHQLDTMDNWIFSDSLPERLRYSIDPMWYGELPRAYFYTVEHQRYSHSGAISEKKLELWLGELQQNNDVIQGKN